MLNYKKLTTKQIKTLCYFATGFSVQKMARKQQVSVSTIRHRLTQIEKKYPAAFDNACGMRNVHKRAKYNIRHPFYLFDNEATKENIVILPNNDILKMKDEMLDKYII